MRTCCQVCAHRYVQVLDLIGSWCYSIPPVGRQKAIIGKRGSQEASRIVLNQLNTLVHVCLSVLIDWLAPGIIFDRIKMPSASMICIQNSWRRWNEAPNSYVHYLESWPARSVAWHLPCVKHSNAAIWSVDLSFMRRNSAIVPLNS